MAIGDHLFVRRAKGLYSHHGIQVSDDKVIHYTSDHWLHERVIRKTEMANFSREGEVEVRDYTALHDAVEGHIDLGTQALRQFNSLLDSVRGLPEFIDGIDLSADAVVHRAEGRLGESHFNINFHNCEHFASWCKTGISDSMQINRLWRLLLAAPEFQRRQLESTMTRMLDGPWNPF